MNHGMADRKVDAVVICPECGADVTVVGGVGICSGKNGWYHIIRKIAGEWKATARERMRREIGLNGQKVLVN